MAEQSHLRASDEQRDATAELLREHFAAGRLTQEELDERLQAAYQARTVHDLDALLQDLPRLPASAAQGRAELAERRRVVQRQLLQQTGGGLGLFLICVVIWVAAGAHGQFWPIWVAIFPVLFLVRNGWRLYGPAPELDRVEAELSRRRSRSDQREQRELRRAERRQGRGRS